MEEVEEEAWNSLRKGIMELEEEGGSWREPAKEPRMISITSRRNLENTRGNQTVKVMESVGVKEEECHDVRGKGEHVIVMEGSGVKNTEVRETRLSVNDGEVTEIGDGVNGVVEVLDGARGVKQVTNGVERAKVMKSVGVKEESHDVRGRGKHVVVKGDSGVKNIEARETRGSVNGVKRVVKVLDGAREVKKVTDEVDRVRNIEINKN